MMSDGETHIKAWKAGIPVSVGVSALLLAAGKQLNLPDDTLLALVIPQFVGYLSGYIIDPDLDQIGITSGEGRAMRSLKILGVFFTMWFFPYAYIMRFVGIGRKGHRNFFSHFPGVSTLIRLLWLYALPVFLWWWYVSDIPTLAWVSFAYYWLGLTLADAIHYILDIRS